MTDPIFPTRSEARIQADDDAELEGWIGERAADLEVQGMEPAEARRMALEEFGDVAGAARYARRQDVAADRRVRVLLWVEELASDLRIAGRTLVRTPTVTAVLLLTFALGLGAPTAVFSLVHALLLRPLPYGDESTLVHLPPVEHGALKPAGRHSAFALKALRERTTSFTGIAGVEIGNFILAGSGDPELVAGSGLTGNGFEVLLARPALGRPFDERDETREGSGVVILSDQVWRARFGADPAVIGRTIDLSGWRMQVVGVMAPGFRTPTYEHAEYFYPRDLAGLLRMGPNVAQNVRFARLFGRLKPGVSLSAAQADVDRVMLALAQELPQSFSGLGVRVVPIREAVAGGVRPRLLLLMGSAGFLFLIMCANTAGVMLSRAIARGPELAIRTALGAGRRRLVRQFLVEGFALALLGTGLGLLVAQLGVLALRRIATSALPAGTAFSLEPRVVAFAIGAALVGAVASSLVPALGATRVPLIALRREERRATGSPSNRRLRVALVAGQLAVSLVLLFGAGLLLRTLHRLSTLDLGYSTERTLTFRVQFPRGRYATDPEEDGFWASFYGNLRAIPGVASVGGGNLPMGGSSTATLLIENRSVAESRLPEVRYAWASDEYFSTLGIPILRGRAFGPTDHDRAPPVGLVSAGLAREFWPGGDPVGARIKLGPALNPDWITIVGVVGDVLTGSAEAPRPSVYTSQRQDQWHGGGAVVIRASGDPHGLAGAVREAVRRVDPTLPVVGLQTLEDVRHDTPAIAERRLLMQLVATFALVALAVAAIGVYGVSAYATEARRREFGIRLALGASQRRVLWLALRDGTTAAGIGVLAGIPLALLLASAIRTVLYRGTAFDPLVVGAGLGMLLLVAWVASYLPARRATRIDPATTLKAD